MKVLNWKNLKAAGLGSARVLGLSLNLGTAAKIAMKIIEPRGTHP
jgi:hypothetical protein